MAYSRVSYTADGSTAEYSIPFPFLNLSSLEVRVGGSLKSVGVDYSVNTSTSKVTLAVTPQQGTAVALRRKTPRGVNERLVVFTDPSHLDAATLNKSDLQLLFIIQEALDDIEQGIGVGGSSGGGTGGGTGGTGGSPLDDPDLDAILDQLIADHNADVANLSAEVQSRANAILAEHNAWVNALLQETTNRNAAILTAKTTLESADASLASQISVVNAQITDPNTGLAKAHARVTAEETARATADTAQANRISTLESQVTTPTTGLMARISNIESTLTSGQDNTALAFRVTELESKVSTGTNNLTARITNEESTRATQYSALSNSVSTVSATANNASTVANNANTNANTALNAANSATAAVTQEASARATAGDDVPCVGFPGDRFYRPFQVVGDWLPYQGSVMSIDPAGRGSDEISYGVAKTLNGNIYVPAAGGRRGGYALENLEWLAETAKRHAVNKIIVESNFGDGMFTALFKPVLARIYECGIEEVHHTTQKEKRIIDTLEPVMNQHRLIIDPRVIRQDYESVSDYASETRQNYMLFYQLSRITKEKGALRHDDRLEALAMAVAYWTKALAQDDEKKIKQRKDELLKAELARFARHVFGHKPKPSGWLNQRK